MMDEQFYENLLQNYEHDKTIVIKKLSKKFAVPKGNNFLSNVFKIQLEGVKKTNGVLKEFQYSLILKEHKGEGDFLNFMDVAFRNEFVSYKKIIPTLNQYSDHPIATAKCILANDKFIILEDLGAKNYANIRKHLWFSLEQIGAILKEIANLHAASIVMQIKNPDEFNNLLSLTTDFMYGSTICPLLQTQEDNIDIAIEILKSKSCHLNEKCIRVLQNLKGKTLQIQNDLIKNPRKFRVINHGDLWANNIMINNTNVKFIDLQIMRFTSVAADLSYFLYINLDPDLRRQKSDDFLCVYLNELNRFLENKNIRLRNNLNLTWLKNEMNDFRLFGFMYGMWLIPMFLQEFEGFKFDESEGLPNFSKEHNERIIKFVYDFVEQEEQ